MLRDVPGPITSNVGVYATSAPIGFWVIAAAAVAVVVFQLWAIIDVIRWPTAAWDSSGLSQVSWVLRVVILGLVGATWYLISPRPRLRAAKRAIGGRDTGSPVP